ncbi:MerR family transcriptional regulator [Aeromicrobium alkaliterrae]|uniref:MerR family transcriptional regulator n=1 Tax=Aeromicrobium alkaliterrae TaxID=302168 RepID=A0ABP4VN86_9ACTN
MSGGAASFERLGIGKVLDELQQEFPDLTITKIRYLESEGLLEPERTPSGYRKFSFGDVERLRFILRQQRDAFWPLSHIRQVLDDLDNGRAPSEETGRHLALAEDGLPTSETFTERPSRARLSREDLLERAGIDDAVLVDIEAHGLIVRRARQKYYDGDDLAIATAVAELARLGVEPRHLRQVRSAAQREADLVDQVVGPRSGEDAQATAAALAAGSIRLHTLVLRSLLQG